MNYSLLTEQQLQKRLYSLPEKIRDVLNSENNIEFVRKICQNHYLNKEKTLIVEQLTGLILLGFVLPDEMSQEISDKLHIDNKHSNDIVSEINRKIFKPIKIEIETIYSPLAEISPEKPLPAPTITKTTTNKEDTAINEKIVDLRPESVLVKTSIDVKIPEIKLSDKEEPKISKEIEISKPKIEEKSGQTEKTDKREKPTPSPITAQQIIKQEEKNKITDGPKIIHEEKKISPLLNTKKSSLGGLFGFLKKENKKEKNLMPIKATIETPTDIKEIQPPKITKTETSKLRVVHYSDLQTPSPFGKNTESHKIAQKTEIEPLKTERPKPPENLPITKAEEKVISLKHRPASAKISVDTKAPENKLSDKEPAITKTTTNKEDVVDLRTFQRFKQ